MRAGSLLLFLPAIVTVATRDEVQSGPAAGAKVAACKVFDVTGLHKGSEVDYAAERKDKPTVYIFINEWDRPVARFLRQLDENLHNDFPDAYLVAMWLTDEPEKLKEHLPLVQQSLRLESTALTVLIGDKKGPENWSLNDQAHVTAVVAVKGEVVKSFAYVAINPEQASETVFVALKRAIQDN